MIDSILCANREEAHKVMDALGTNLIDWEFMENGKIKIYFDHKILEEEAAGDDRKN